MINNRETINIIVSSLKNEKIYTVNCHCVNKFVPLI